MELPETALTSTKRLRYCLTPKSTLPGDNFGCCLQGETCFGCQPSPTGANRSDASPGTCSWRKKWYGCAAAASLCVRVGMAGTG